MTRSYGREPLGAALAERSPPVILPPAVPWPPPAKLTENSTLVVRIPEESYDDIIALPSLIGFLETGFAQFAGPAREAWSTVWRAVPQAIVAGDDGDGNDPDEGDGDGDGGYRYEYLGEPTPLPIATLLRAVDACEALRSASWDRFRTHLRHAAAGLPTDAHVVAFVYY
ncbi:MAG: hypothetical protein H0T79_07460 [Deltaproteobacteria bacterium]|nr:hypothetical protein [Deltaproteobacteria bacterium]